MENITYLGVGLENNTTKQKGVFTRRWRKMFEENGLNIEAKNIRWSPILNGRSEWKDFKEERSDNKFFVVYNLPEVQISERIYRKVKQNKYVAGNKYIAELGNLLHQIHDDVNKLDATFLHTPETYINDKNKYQNYKLAQRLNVPTPETENLDSFDDLVTFINDHQDIYLKPVAGTMGRGITRVTKLTQESGKYQVSTKLNLQNPLKSSENTPLQSFACDSKLELQQEMEPLLEYISLAQRAINSPPLTHHGIELIWDMRFLNICPHYYDKILTAGVRAAPKQQIQTNLSAGGQELELENLVDGDETKCSIEFGKKEFNDLKRDTLKLAKGANMFEIGADFIYDSDGQRYSIEINGNPGYKTGYYSGMTIGDYAIMGVLITHLGTEDFYPQLKDITYEDIFLEHVAKANPN